MKHSEIRLKYDSVKRRVTGLDLHFKKTPLIAVCGKIIGGSKSPGR